MKMRVFAALALAAGLTLGCSNPKGNGSTASSGDSASSGESNGSSGSGSDSSGATSGSSSSGSGGTTATTGEGSSGSSGSSGAQASCIGGQACTYDNDCGGSKTCLYHDNEPGCCVDTGDNCRNGSAAYGPCAPGWMADPGNTDCCVLADGGGTGGTTGTCVFDGGVSGGVCSPDCQHGFHCENGECVLNGGNGPIQVTLQYGNFDDLDLHVVQPDGCEVWYGNTDCTNGGSLDLDSNAGCGQSTVDAENVIYTPLDAGGAVPPSGTYTVRVDMYENCDNAASIPFLVKIRHNGITDTYCSGFDSTNGQPFPGDNGSQGSGRTIATFTYP